MVSPLRRNNPLLGPREDIDQDPLQEGLRPTPGQYFDVTTARGADFARGLHTTELGLEAGSFYRAADKAIVDGQPDRARRLVAEGDRLIGETQHTAQRVKSHTEVENLGDAVDYLQGGFGQLLPTMGPPMAAGVVGAIGGAALAGPLGIAPGIAAGIAGAGAAAIPAFQMEAGEQASSQYADPYIRENTTAAERLREQNIKGAQNAALESLFPAIFGGRVIGGAARRIAGEALRKSPLRRTLAVGREGATEAGTELAQTMTGQASLSRMNPNRDTTHDYVEQIDSLILGALGGTSISLGTTVPGYMTERISQRLGEKGDVALNDVGRAVGELELRVLRDQDETGIDVPLKPSLMIDQLPESEIPKFEKIALELQRVSNIYGPDSKEAQRVVKRGRDFLKRRNAEIVKREENVLSQEEEGQRAFDELTLSGTQGEAVKYNESGMNELPDRDVTMQQTMGNNVSKARLRHVPNDGDAQKDQLFRWVNQKFVSPEAAEAAKFTPLDVWHEQVGSSDQDLINEAGDIVRDLEARAKAAKGREDHQLMHKRLRDEIEAFTGQPDPIDKHKLSPLLRTRNINQIKAALGGYSVAAFPPGSVENVFTPQDADAQRKSWSTVTSKAERQALDASDSIWVRLNTGASRRLLKQDVIKHAYNFFRNDLGEANTPTNALLAGIFADPRVVGVLDPQTATKKFKNGKPNMQTASVIRSVDYRSQNMRQAQALEDPRVRAALKLDPLETDKRRIQTAIKEDPLSDEKDTLPNMAEAVAKATTKPLLAGTEQEQDLNFEGRREVAALRRRGDRQEAQVTRSSMEHVDPEEVADPTAAANPVIRKLSAKQRRKLAGLTTKRKKLQKTLQDRKQASNPVKIGTLVRDIAATDEAIAELNANPEELGLIPMEQLADRAKLIDTMVKLQERRKKATNPEWRRKLEGRIAAIDSALKRQGPITNITTEESYDPAQTKIQERQKAVAALRRAEETGDPGAIRAAERAIRRTHEETTGESLNSKAGLGREHPSNKERLRRFRAGETADKTPAKGARPGDQPHNYQVDEFGHVVNQNTKGKKRGKPQAPPVGGQQTQQTKPTIKPPRKPKAPPVRGQQAAPQAKPAPTQQKALNIYFGSNENAELSNLADRPFTYGDREYRSVEHAYQTLKSGEFDAAAYRSKARKPRATKRVNTDISYRLLTDLIRESFQQNPKAAEKLLATGDAQLTHTQDRSFWGKMFPQALTQVRSELAKAPAQQKQEPWQRGLPEHTIDRNLKNKDGSKMLAGVNRKTGEIRINPVETTQEFFDYFEGRVDSTTSKQKRKVLSALVGEGWPRYKIRRLINTPEKANQFLVLHDQNHKDENDLDVYFDQGADYLTDDKIAMETRASKVALDQLAGNAPMPGQQAIKPSKMANDILYGHMAKSLAKHGYKLVRHKGEVYVVDKDGKRVDPEKNKKVKTALGDNGMILDFDTLEEAMDDPDVKKRVDAATKWLIRAFGPEITKTLKWMLAREAPGPLGLAGYFDPESKFIHLAADSVDPLGFAFHEGMHKFVNSLGKEGNPQVYDRMVKAATAPHVMKQMEKMLENYPAAIADIHRDPEEAVAYAFQFYAASRLPGGPEFRIQPSLKNTFAKIVESIKRMLGLMTHARASEKIFDALFEGRVNRDGMEPLRKYQERSFEAYAKDVMDGIKNSVPRALSSPIIQLAKQRNADGNQIKAFQELADAWHSQPLKGTPTGLVYRKAQLEGQYRNRWHKILADNKATKEDMKKALKNMQSMKAPSNQLEKNLQHFFQRMYAYQFEQGKNPTQVLKVVDEKTGKKEWVKPNKVDNYWPRIWSAEEILANEIEFREVMAEEGKLDDETITNFIEMLQATNGLEVGGELQQYRADFTPYNKAVNARVFDFINKDNAHKFAKFQEQDMAKVMDRYIRQAVARREHSRTFEHNGAGVTALLARAKKQGATDEQIAYAEKVVQGLEGRLGTDKVSDLQRELMVGSMSVTNFAVLAMATLSSMVDPLGVMVRTGSLKSAAKTFKTGFAQILADARKQKVPDQEITEYLGIIEEDMVQDMLNNMERGIYMNEKLRKMNKFFFKSIGLEQWTRGTRVGATRASMEYLKKYKNDAKRLAELDLKPGDIQEFEGRIKLKPEEFKTGKKPTAEDIELARKVQNATYRMTEESILRPTAAIRPLWASDMRFRLLGHLKGYTFAWHNQILRQVMERARNAENRAQAALAFMPLLSYVPVMIAADMVRDMISGDDRDRDLAETGYRAIRRSAILGMGTFLMDIESDMDYGGLPTNTVLGPVIDSSLNLGRTALNPDASFLQAGAKLLPYNALWRKWGDE